MYKIVRHYQNGHKRTLKTGLTLDQARQHCRDPETSSRTATSKAALNRTRFHGPWFDGFEECRR